jgi:hypothetical protein
MAEKCEPSVLPGKLFFRQPFTPDTSVLWPNCCSSVYSLGEHLDSIKRTSADCDIRGMSFTFDVEKVCGIKPATNSSSASNGATATTSATSGPDTAASTTTTATDPEGASTTETADSEEIAASANGVSRVVATWDGVAIILVAVSGLLLW